MKLGDKFILTLGENDMVAIYHPYIATQVEVVDILNPEEENGFIAEIRTYDGTTMCVYEDEII